MERQKSFSYKHAKILIFFFTISFSIIFLTICTAFLYKSTPQFPQQTTSTVDATTTTLNFTPLQTLTAFTKNLSSTPTNSSILSDTQSKTPQKTSGFSTATVIDQERRSKDGNFTTAKERVTDSSILSDTQLKTPQNTSGFLTITVIDRERRSKDGNFNSTSVKESSVSVAPDPVVVVEDVQVTAIEKSKERKFERKSGIEKRIEMKRKRGCDVTRGTWVYDESYPLYTNKSCPFIDEGFDCMGNGRLDRDYLKWRWQPHDCNIPRFNATRMLNLIRGKRLIFIGDSINRNQWESMLCMLIGAIKNPKRVYETHGRRITKEKGNYSFRFLVDYGCTIEYYVSHYLVHEGKARIGQKRVQTLRIDSIDRGSSRWRGADIVIFNTAHWWSHYKTKAGINYYQEGNLVHPKLDVSTAFSRALTTWARWVDKNINSRKTRVFFRSSSPSHFRGGEWNSGGHCQEASLPLKESPGLIYNEKNAITEEIIKQMKTPVNFLNITTLSGLRIDGHPSMYGKKFVKKSGIQDCSHWCLPGVPDAWNELLYYHLQSKLGDDFL